MILLEAGQSAPNNIHHFHLKKKNGVLKCRFSYPKDLQPVTSVVTEDGKPTLMTQRNDHLLNSYNPLQLSAWRSNVDMQFIVSRRRAPRLSSPSTAMS